MSLSKINIQALIKGSIEQVWGFYTLPEHITQWNAASDDWYCPSAENDLKVGGKYKARMEARDGSFGFDFEATYDALDIPTHFTYTMTDGRQVSVRMEEVSEGTLVSISFDPEQENPVELQREGWQAILNNFKRYAEGG